MTQNTTPTEAQVSEAVRVIRLAGAGMSAPKVSKGNRRVVSYAQVRKAERVLAAFQSRNDSK